MRIALYVIDTLVFFTGAGRLKKVISFFHEHENEIFIIFLITAVFVGSIIIIEL